MHRTVLTILGVFCFALLYKPAVSQYYSMGQDPATTQWNQIRTDNFRLIYPVNFEKKAKYMANALEQVYHPISDPMDAQPIMMPVVFHNQTTYSNASVAYAPRRMEFLTTPPQDSYSQDWLDQLVLHEFRHAVHYEKMRQGFTKGLSYVFGEQTTALMLGMFVPFWFIEGDATVTETIFSESGRGRDPLFEMKVKAQFLDNGIYHYDKATHGSYKDFTPNMYELGYHLIGQSQLEFGRNIWSSPLDRVARKPFTFVPFSHGIHLETGLGKVKLYRKLTNELKDSWQKIQEVVPPGQHKNITGSKKVFTEYENISFLNDSVIVATQTRIDGIPHLYTINIHSGEENKFFTPGVRTFHEKITVTDSIVIWSERIPDPRWQLRNYAVIRTYDFRTKKSSYITRKTKYFAPAISPDKSRLAVVEVSADNKYSLLILEYPSGRKIRSINFEGNKMIQTPAWRDNSKELAVILVGANGKSLITLDIQSDLRRTVLEDSFTEIRFPVYYKNFILFTGSYSGINNVYAIDTTTLKILQVTSVPYGVNTPNISPDNSKLVFQNYGADGYRAAIIDLDTETWKPIYDDRRYSLNLFKAFKDPSRLNFRQEDVPDTNYQSSKYKKAGNLFKFHSWGPISIDADNQEINPGISVLSQNLLSTSFFNAGYEYNLNEEAGKFYLKYSFAGWYPIIDIDADYGRRRATIRQENGDLLNISWKETEVGTTIRLPFDFTRKRYFRSFQPSFGISYIHRNLDEGTPVKLSFSNLVSITYRLYYSQTAKSSRRDIFPRFGQAIDLVYRHDPFNTSGFSPTVIFGAAGWIYFPSAFRNHGIRIYLAHQSRSEGGRLYSNVISMPRGMTGIPALLDLTSGKVDYALPLFYPDWRLGPIMYIKRFKSRLFFDYLAYNMDGQQLDYTTGLDVTADFHLVSLLAPFEMGARFIYYPQATFASDSFMVQFLFSFNISGF